MGDLLGVWSKLGMKQRVALIAATLGVFMTVLMISRLGTSSSQTLLYAGLDSGAAGQVIAALDQNATPYEVRGDAIYVSAADRDSLRMQLAAQGLPASGGQGYELLDGLSGFGTTSQMFDAAYWRAKEGELARTALALPGVRMARVHISPQSPAGFLKSADVTASITVTMQSGQLTRERADALRHLLASAVGRISPDDVTVIDSVGGLVLPASDDLTGEGTNPKSDAIKRNVERLLEARVGAGRAVVEVSVDLAREREAITERVIDPQTRIAISSENESRSENSTQSNGDVTVASNLPDGDAAGGTGGNSQSSSSTERLNFDVSETQRQIVREPGSIRRLSIAVLVDGKRSIGTDGVEVWEPRTDQELSDLRELVAAASGFEEARGDSLTLKSMEFQMPPAGGTMAEAGLLNFGQIDLMTLAQIVILALVCLVLALFVVRPLVLQRPAAAQTLPPPLPTPLPAPAGRGDLALTGEIADGDLPALSVVNPRGDERGADMGAGMGADPVERLKRLIDERQQESVEILRGWMERQEERS